MTLVLAILNALAAIPAIAKYVERFCAAIVTWWISRQKSETKAALADALAFGARANSQEDRFKADDLWAKAISSPRVSS